MSKYIPKKNDNPAKYNMYKIAIDTIKNPSKSLLSKDYDINDAIKILKTKFGFSDNDIKNLKEDKMNKGTKLKSTIRQIVKEEITSKNRLNESFKRLPNKSIKDIEVIKELFSLLQRRFEGGAEYTDKDDKMLDDARKTIFKIQQSAKKFNSEEEVPNNF